MECRAWLTPFMETGKSLKAVLKENVRAFMDKHHLVESEFAKLAGVAPASVWRVLHDQNVTVETLGALAKPFKFPAWALLLPDLDLDSTPIADTQQRFDARVEARAKELARVKVAKALSELDKILARDPESVVFEEVYATADAGVICFQYRARNGFGGMGRELLVLAHGEVSQEAIAWVRHCPSDSYDVAFIGGTTLHALPALNRR
jgi:transcriptional regulator with XRE-family HTH domain